MPEDARQGGRSGDNRSLTVAAPNAPNRDREGAVAAGDDESRSKPVKRPPLTVAQVVNGVLSRERTVIARALTLFESALPQHRAIAEEALDKLLPHAGGAIRLGVSGPPGAGKSAFIERLGASLLEQGRRVAVLAVDPSSEISGGSLLGDKTRMETLSRSDDALVRPSPTGLHLGGVAPRTRECIFVCEAAGFDVVIVETVGVGQSEAQVASMVDFFLLLTIAGAGDELQGIKRGVLELVDLVAVNKADDDGEARAHAARSQLEQALRLLRPPVDGWRPPVIACSALTGRGVAEIWRAVVDRVESLRASGALALRRSRQNVRWFDESLQMLLRQRILADPAAAAARSQMEAQVAAGLTAPSAAARFLLDELLPPSRIED